MITPIGVNHNPFSFQQITKTKSGIFFLVLDARRALRATLRCYIEISGFPIPKVLYRFPLVLNRDCVTAGTNGHIVTTTQALQTKTQPIE